MRQTGKSRAEVEAAARAKGYTVYGSQLALPGESRMAQGRTTAQGENQQLAAILWNHVGPWPRRCCNHLRGQPLLALLCRLPLCFDPTDVFFFNLLVPVASTLALALGACDMSSFHPLLLFRVM